MVNELLATVRERVSKKREARQARQRKQRAKEALESNQRQKRIERNNPEGTSEKVQASTRQAKLLASELGITRKRAQSLVDQGAELLDTDGDGVMDGLDIDGDGRTDVLLEAEQEAVGGLDAPGVEGEEVDVGTVEAELGFGEGNGVEDEVGLDDLY